MSPAFLTAAEEMGVSQWYRVACWIGWEQRLPCWPGERSAPEQRGGDGTLRLITEK